MEREQLTATVRAAQQGDEKALNLLFNTYYNDVYYFALRTLKDEDLACDITQETFVEIINTLQDLKEPAAFVTWMRQVTYHQCTRYFKKKKEVLVEEDEEGNSVFDTLEEEREEFIPGEGVDQEDFRATILALLDTLSEEQRAAVLMHYYHEMSVKEIAEAQKVSEGTVKSRLNYARKSLKKSVEDYEKKHDVKLHCAGVLPLLLWLFASAGKEVMPVAAAKTVAGGIASATGVSVALSAGGGVAAATGTAVAGTGLMAKIAALPVAVKIISGITAGALLIGSVAVVNNSLEKDLEPTVPVIMQTDPTTGNQEGNNSSSETTAPSGPVETQPAPSQTEPSQPGEEPIAPPTQPSTPSEDSPVGSADPDQADPDQADPDQTDPDDDTLTENTESIVGNIIPAGCTYTMKDGTVLTEGQAMPEKMQDGESLTTEDYVYQFDGSSWSVEATDKEKTQYEPLYSKINGVPITNLSFTFYRCSAMTIAPAIPKSVSDMEGTFYFCYSLVDAPIIPEGVTDLRQTFQGCLSLENAPLIPEGVTDLLLTFCGCSSLVNAPIIPKNVTNMERTFEGCSSLVNAPVIPKGVFRMTATFRGCTSLVNAPVIPEGVFYMAGTFSGCTAMVNAPAIPKGVVYLSGAFAGCTALMNAPVIPDSVQYMDSTFEGCTALVDAPAIPGRVTDMKDTFAGCTSLVSAPDIPSSVSYMDRTFNGCTSLTGTVIINANLISYYDCFTNTEKTIVLIGESQNLADLEATSSLGNVTVDPTLLSEND